MGQRTHTDCTTRGEIYKLRCTIPHSMRSRRLQHTRISTPCFCAPLHVKKHLPLNTTLLCPFFLSFFLFTTIHGHSPQQHNFFPLFHHRFSTK